MSMIIVATFSASLTSLSNPPGSSVLVAAVTWLEGTLLGTLATTIAVIAVSWLGMLMLAGRLEIRRGITAIIGCFILFGASAIAGGIQSFVGSEPRMASIPPPPVPPPAVPPPRPSNPDPYAGAALPRP